jgi:hypothetical protein
MFLLLAAAVICGGLIGVSAVLAVAISLFGGLIYRRAAAEGIEALEAWLRAAARGA